MCLRRKSVLSQVRAGSLPILLAALGGCQGKLDAGRDTEPLTAITEVAPTPTTPGEPTPVTETDTTPPPTATSIPSESVDAGPTPSAGQPIEPDASSEQPPIDSGAPGEDAGVDASEDNTPDGPLPINANNPVVLINDNVYDNWAGEMALLASSAGRINLVGIVVSTSAYWPESASNEAGWRDLVDSARRAGLQNLPEIVVSQAPALVPPPGENVDATAPNGSEGAQFIVRVANEFGNPERPLAIISGSSLTEVADAYLLDPSLPDRVVAAAALGQPNDNGSFLAGPNGENDTWAGIVVAQRVPLVQVTAYYEQVNDVPQGRAGQLPPNAFGAWIAGKRDQVENSFAADQVALLAGVLPEFATVVRRVGYAGMNSERAASLTYNEQGCCWLVSEGDGVAAANYLWDMLLAPDAFSP